MLLTAGAIYCVVAPRALLHAEGVVRYTVTGCVTQLHINSMELGRCLRFSDEFYARHVGNSKYCYLEKYLSRPRDRLVLQPSGGIGHDWCTGGTMMAGGLVHSSFVTQQQCCLKCSDNRHHIRCLVYEHCAVLFDLVPSFSTGIGCVWPRASILNHTGLFTEVLTYIPRPQEQCIRVLNKGFSK